MRPDQIIQGIRLKDQAVETFTRIDVRGIRINPATLKTYIEDTTRELDEIFTRTNTTTTSQMKKLATEAASQDPTWPQTESGKISLTQSIAEKCSLEIVKDYVKAAALARQVSSFKKMAQMMSISGTERLYPEHKVEGKTGRVYVGRFNYTNLNKKYRPMVVPEEHQVFFELDINRAEMVILAYLAEDFELQAALKSEDFHTATAARLFGVNPEDVTPAQRDQAKIVSFSIVYGASATFLSGELEISEIDAQAIIDRFFSIYPDAAVFLNRVYDTGVKTGYSETAFGTPRIFPEGEGRGRSALSHTIQSTAGELVRMAVHAVETAAHKVGGELTLSVFDSYLVSIPSDECTEQSVKFVKMAAEKVWADLGMPLELEITPKGEHWS